MDPETMRLFRELVLAHHLLALAAVAQLPFVTDGIAEDIYATRYELNRAQTDRQETERSGS